MEENYLKIGERRKEYGYRKSQSEALLRRGCRCTGHRYGSAGRDCRCGFSGRIEVKGIGG